MSTFLPFRSSPARSSSSPNSALEPSMTDEIGPVFGTQPRQLLPVERAVAVGVVPGEEPPEPGRGEAPLRVVHAGVASMLAGVDAACVHGEARSPGGRRAESSVDHAGERGGAGGAQTESAKSVVRVGERDLAVAGPYRRSRRASGAPCGAPSSARSGARGKRGDRRPRRRSPCGPGCGAATVRLPRATRLTSPPP